MTLGQVLERGLRNDPTEVPDVHCACALQRPAPFVEFSRARDPLSRTIQLSLTLMPTCLHAVWQYVASNKYFTCRGITCMVMFHVWRACVKFSGPLTAMLDVSCILRLPFMRLAFASLAMLLRADGQWEDAQAFCLNATAR